MAGRRSRRSTSTTWPRRAPGGPPPFLVAVDGVTDPGNLGALLRSAECAGATGVVLPRHRAVHVTPTVTKAAAGAVEHLPLRGGRRPARRPASSCQELGVWVVGLDGDGDGDLWSMPAADGPIALVLGAEGSGLSRLVRQRCDAVVRIPLRGSLGVAERRRRGRAGLLRGGPRARRVGRSGRTAQTAQTFCFRFFRFVPRRSVGPPNLTIWSDFVPLTPRRRRGSRVTSPFGPHLA